MARLPWLILGVSIGLKAVAIGLAVAVPPAHQSPDGLGFLAWAPGVVAFAIVGAVVAARRPENAVGWLFLAVGAAEPFTIVADTYARLAMAGTAGALPGGAWIAALGATVNALFLGVIVAIILLFPTGQPPSPRWRPVLAIVAAWLAVLGLATLLAPGPIGGSLPLQNPIAAPGVAGEVAAEIAALGEVSAVPLILLTVPALLLRWRRADGAERAQLKWFASSITLLAFVAVAIVPVWELVEGLPPAVEGLFTVLTIGSVAAIPLAAGVAILRYRLYDIDVVIRRTLIYAVVVGILGALYGGLVLGLQVLLTPVTGGDILPVALSTLAIAALFGPVRARVRAAVDRRFYRSRYDAQRTLEAFATDLRDGVELDEVARRLVAATDRAVAPRGASVWIRRPGAVR